MFSIIIPSFNNLNYLKLCIKSLKKNSKFAHEIIIHVNEGTDGTLDYVVSNKLMHTHTEKNVGLCTAINLAAKKANTNYILYSHDDMYFCPEWDIHLINEVNKIGHDKFYLSAVLIEAYTGHIKFNCGETTNRFNEDKLLKNYKKKNFYD